MKTEEEDDDDVTIGVSRYPCLPSLVALQQMRNRLHMAHDGKRLMKWSAMATGRELRRIAEDIDGVYHKFHEDVRNCFILLARCRYFFHNFNRMVLESVAREACVTVNTSTKSVTGVRITLYEVVESGLDPYPHLGIERGGETVLETKKAWLELLKRLINMLELRRSFMMLDIAHNNAQKGTNLDDSTMPYWDYAINVTSSKNNEKKQGHFGFGLEEIKVAEKKIAGSLHICKNCLAMFESYSKDVRGAVCADCTKVETSTRIRKCKRSEQFTYHKKENKTESDMSSSAEVKTTISNLVLDNCSKRVEENKENSIFAKVKQYALPYAKAVTCMNMQNKVPSKKKSKSNSKELGTFENKFRQIVKVVRSKNSDGSVSEEKKTITIKTEKTKPSCSQATSAHSSSSVRKNTNVTSSFKESSSKKDKNGQNTSKLQSRARQTRSEKIALNDTLAAPRLKTSLSDDTIQIISIDSTNTKEPDRMTTLKENESFTHINIEEKTDEPCVCDVPEKTSKVRIKDVCSIHALRPARTLMELTNSQKLKSPVDSENVSLVSFATSYSLDERSIQMSAQDVLKSELSEDKTICTDVSDNKLEKDTVCSASFIRQIGIDDDEKTKIVSTKARWRDAGAATSNKNRISSIPSYTKLSTKLFSTNYGVHDRAFENKANVLKIEQHDTSDTNAHASNATQTTESSFPIACQSTDRSPKLIDEFGFQLPTSKMFINFPETMTSKNISNNHNTDRPAVKSFDYKSNEMKRLEEMYRKIKNRQNECVNDSSKPSAAFPRAKRETKDKLQSDSMSRLSHDIPIRTRMHNESPRVSGEIIYSHLDPKLVRKCNKATKGIKESKYLSKSDAMIETDMKITNIKMPVTESRGTSPVGSFPLIPLKIHEIVPKNYGEPPQRVTVATSPELSLAKLPVISTSSQLTLTQNVLNNELPKIPSVTPPPNQRGLESNSICEIKIVSKNFNYNTLASQDTELTVERLKKLLKNNKVEDFEKIIHPTVKVLTKVPADTNFPRPHIVCAVTPMISEAEIKASSCNSMTSCPNPECPVKKMCCIPKPEKKPEPAIPQEKVDVAVSTFERDKPKRKVDFEDSACKSTCSVPVELPKCAKCRATLQRADASTSTKNNVRYDVRPLSKLIFTRVITETQSDSCLYCGKPCGKPGFRQSGQRNIKSPSPSFHSCTKPIPKAESAPTCRFAECDC